MVATAFPSSEVSNPESSAPPQPLEMLLSEVHKMMYRMIKISINNRRQEHQFCKADTLKLSKD